MFWGDGGGDFINISGEVVNILQVITLVELFLTPYDRVGTIGLSIVCCRNDDSGSRLRGNGTSYGA